MQTATIPTLSSAPPFAVKVESGTFDSAKHYYSRVLNAQIHPQISFLLNLDRRRLISRYCHLHPGVDKNALGDLLDYSSQYLRWAGADLFNVTTASGRRQMVLIETNSCPSGQKSMPLRDEFMDQGGYRLIVEELLAPYVQEDETLAVVYDKNLMEASGYAAAMADQFQRPVWLVRFDQRDPEPPVRFIDGWMQVRSEDGEWHRVHTALRYVTQRPWNRIPVSAIQTKILNPTIACLAGGRNKLVAAKAYELFNAEVARSGLRIAVPHTINDVSRMEIPLVIRSLGGRGVVKIPYSNAGQGVYTILNDAELDEFMSADIPYDQFIVQSLIGNSSWSSLGPTGSLYHVGTVPNKKNDIYVADLRFMVCSGPEGFKPVAIYARRAAQPLADSLDDGNSSWNMLGTNLSIKKEDGSWDSDTSRLVLMDKKDFNTLGIGLDDLIEAYIQTVLAVIAIDKMAGNLINKKGVFKKRLFRSLDKDDTLLNEILSEPQA